MERAPIQEQERSSRSLCAPISPFCPPDPPDLHHRAPSKVTARPQWLQKPGRFLHPCPVSASGLAEPHVVPRTPLPRAPRPPTSQPQHGGGAASSTQPQRCPRSPGRPGLSSLHPPGCVPAPRHPSPPATTHHRLPSSGSQPLPPSSQPVHVHSPPPCPHGPLLGDPPRPSALTPKPHCPPALLATGPRQESLPTPSPTVSTTQVYLNKNL